MTRTFAVMLAFLLCAAGCTSEPQPATSPDHVAAANRFTEDYSRSRLSKWNLRAHASGTDCKVLFVETSMILEDSLVEALHYGAGAYAVYDGGVHRFCRERSFRGVAYRDRSGRVWPFGEVAASEANTLKACR